MRRYAILALLLTALPAGRVSATANFNPKSTGLPIGGGAMAGDLDFAGNDAKNLDDLWADPVATDAAPRVTVLGTQPVFVEPGATNIDGANMVLAPSPGAQTLEGVTLAETTGDVLGFDVYSNGVLTHTDKTEGVDWDCDGAGTDIICVCNLWDDFVANPIVGVVVTRTDVTCSDEKLTFSIDPRSDYLAVTTSDDANLDMTAGADGQVMVHAGRIGAGIPTLAFSGDPNTGFTRHSNDSIQIITGGAEQMRLRSTNILLGTALDIASYYITGTAGTRINFPAAEQTRFCNAAESQCFVFAATAAGTATLFDGVGTGVAVLNMQDGGSVWFDGLVNSINSLANILNFHGQEGFAARMELDNSTDGGAMFLFDTHPNAEMTADGNGEVQYALHVTPELAMTNASAFVGWEHDPEITSQGTAQNYHYRLDWSDDGVYEQKVQDDGDIILHEDPGSDTDPLDGRIFGANAWSQASPGTTSNGANLEFFAGVRKMALVCANPAISDQDEIVFTVNGVAQAALIESTDWDCFGETADQCCINLAAAIVTADYGITPDAVTLAGTVYLTPDEDLGSVDSIVLTDSIAADGHGITLTEGTDGVIRIAQGTHLALDTDLDTFIFASADDDMRFWASGSARLRITSSLIQSYEPFQVPAGDYITFAGLTKWTSLGGDGIWEMGINAGTRGVRFDAATTDGVLSLYDETGGPLQLKFAESDIAERTNKSAKVTTTDALDNLIASVTLADGEVLTIEATILGRERDGSDRNVYHIQGLFYRQGAGAVQQGVSTYIAEMESDIDWCGDLAVSGNDVQITVDGNGDTVDWEVTYTYQILISAA